MRGDDPSILANRFVRNFSHSWNLHLDVLAADHRPKLYGHQAVLTQRTAHHS
jgi:hypothetical protein